MKITAYTNSSGSSVWRIIDPFKYINKYGYDIQAEVSKNSINDEELMNSDVVLLQSTVDKEGIAAVRAYQKETGLKVLCDIDDWLFERNKDNPFNKDHEVTDSEFVIRKTLEFADGVVTTTPYLGNKLKEINKNVYLFPNYMDLHRWEKNKNSFVKDEVRIGWVGSMTHLSDFEVCIDPLKRIMDKYKNVKLLVIGDPRIKNYFLGYNVESYLGVPFEIYPDKLANLGIDIGIAPLKDTEFNRCKSNIKPLEYGINGIPSVVSDIEPYKKFESKDCGVFLSRDESEWYDNLEYLVKNTDDRVGWGKEAKKMVKKDYDLSKNIKKYLDILEDLRYECVSGSNTSTNRTSSKHS